MSLIRRLQHPLALGLDELDQIKMDDRGGHQGQPGVMMVVVVPVNEGPGPGVSRPQGGEAVRKIGPVLHGFELRLGIRIVIGGVGPGVGFGHLQVPQ